jgi:hypothetical protein
MDLHLNWNTPRNLDVTYGPSGRPGDEVTLDFQAVRFSDVTITVHRE